MQSCGSDCGTVSGPPSREAGQLSRAGPRSGALGRTGLLTDAAAGRQDLNRLPVLLPCSFGGSCAPCRLPELTKDVIMQL